MKEKKYIALQIACGDITDVKIEQNNFIINTQEKDIYDILCDEKNKQIILDALRWQNIYGNLIVNKIVKKEELQTEDLNKLRKLSLEVKIIKGDK